MSSMLKLLSLLLLLSSISFASNNEKIVGFIKAKLKQAGPSVKVEKIAVAKEYKLRGHGDWKLYFVDVKLTVTQKGITKPAEQRYEIFSDGNMVSLELLNIKTGESLKALAAPKFDKKFYSHGNLIAGNENAEHKIVVFSDPLCPFCTRLVPSLIIDAQKQPKKFALYLYHFPLSMHPAASVMVKCMVAAEHKGIKNVAYKIYSIDKGKEVDEKTHQVVNPAFTANETNEKRVLNEFNKALGSKLSIADINSVKVLNHIRRDKNIQKEMLVNSTPSVYVNGEKDPNHIKYNNLKK